MSKGGAHGGVTSSDIEALLSNRQKRWKALCTCQPHLSIRNSRDCFCGAAEQVMACRICKTELELRTSRAGELFWGCGNFSLNNCCYTERIDADSVAHTAPTTTTPTAAAAGAADPISSPVNRQSITVPRAIVTDSFRIGSSKVLRHGSDDDDAANPESPTTRTKRRLFPAADRAELAEAEIARSFIGPNGARYLATLRCTDLHYHSRPDSPDSELPFSYYFRDGRQHCKKTRRSIDRIPTVVDLFAGAGGMGLGFQQAGFDLACSVDRNSAAVETIRANDTQAIVFRQDVKDFLGSVAKGETGYPTTADHLNACPPCQDFSFANRKSRTSSPHEKPRNALSLLVIEAARILQPTTVSFENVTGILDTDNKVYLQQIVTELLGMGYQVRAMKLNAKHFGVPQHRERIILLAAKKGFPLPKEPTSDGSVFSVEEALHDLAWVDPVLDRSIDVPCNGGKRVFDHVEWRPQHGEGTKLRRDRVSETVLRQNTIQHYEQDRDLTMRERARLQSFPDRYRFCGTPQEQSDQIGNAVPVRMAAAIGKSVMDSYRKFYGPSVAER